MSLLTLFSDLKTKLFGNSKVKSHSFLELENGLGQKINDKQSYIEMKSSQDLENENNELCEKFIIFEEVALCGDVAIDIIGFEKCQIIENYVSFMELINYLSSPIKDRETYNYNEILKVYSGNKFILDKHKSLFIIIEYLDDTFHLCKSNIM